MKLTNDELTTLKNLSNTEVGSFLVRYLKRVQDHIFDSRFWGEKDNRETADRASKIIQENIINKLLPQSMDVKKSAEEGDDTYE